MTPPLRHLRLLAALAALGAAAPGCASGALASAPPPAVADTLSLLGPWLDHLAADRHLPGLSLVIVRGSTPLWSRRVGFADLATARPLGPDTRVFAGSVTKLFTAVLTLALRDAGRLDLDAPVRRYLPDFAVAGDGAGAVTVRQLLTHRSGLRREGPDPYWMTYRFPDAATLRSELASLPLEAPPGTRTRYSNVGYAVLGEVLAAAGGAPYADLLDTRVLGPLGLRATTASGDAAERSAAATAYSRELRHLHGARVPREHGDAAAFAAAFGLLTTERDLAAFASFLLGAHPRSADVLSAASRAELLAPDAAWPTWTEARGLGFELVRRKGLVRASHNGWFSGHRAQISLVPEASLAVVVLANADDAPVADLADRVLDDLIDAEALAAARAGAPTPPAPDPAAAGLAGLYGAGWVPERDVVLLSDGLHQYTPVASTETPIRHGLALLLPDGAPDAFRVGHADGQPIHFTRAADGRGVRLWLEDGTVWLDRRSP